MGTSRSSKKSSKNFIKKILLCIGIVILALILAVNLYLGNAGKPVDSKNTQTVSIVVPPGSGTGNIATILAEENLIKNVTAFKIQSKLKGNDGKYKSGTYTLSPSMPMAEIMDLIIIGNTDTIRFTIPEGYDIKRTTDKLAEQGLIHPDVFSEEIEFGEFDYKFLKDAPAGPNRLEGYLYPETYDIFTTATEKDVIDRMLSHFDKVFTQEYYDRAEELGMDINEVLTIASLIERETRVKAEKEIVASVIQNRIDAGMPLQIDATIQYALGEQKERLLYADLEIDSPYNTYKIKGLPPGPICSPSIDSIYAALHPADTTYLYYVLKPSMDGSHAFSSEYNQFLKDKDSYIKNAFGD